MASTEPSQFSNIILYYVFTIGGKNNHRFNSTAKRDAKQQFVKYLTPIESTITKVILINFKFK
jgi:hypothetical protein